MRRKKWMASLLNLFVPGLGYFYNQKARKGLLSYIIFLSFVLVIRLVAYDFVVLSLMVCAVIAYYLFLMITAYREVDENKVYEETRYDRWYIYFMAAVLLLLFQQSMLGKILDRVTPINFARIVSPAMEPTLQMEDQLAFVKTKAISRNDLVMFWYPDDIKTLYVKRCVGMPGDSVEIEGRVALVNGKEEAIVTPLQFRYLLHTRKPIDSRLLEAHGISRHNFSQLSPEDYFLFVTAEKADTLSQLEFVDAIDPGIDEEGERDPHIYPPSTTADFDWNTDYYGPVYLPRRGDKLPLTGKNVDFYLRCIDFENNRVERDSSGITIDGQLVTEYVFQENYYFMLGDSRNNSLDSRYWGPLPESLVVGTPLYLYWGSTSDRIGKRISREP